MLSVPSLHSSPERSPENLLDRLSITEDNELLMVRHNPDT